MTNKTNILLSIDGGGIRDFIPTIISKEIEKIMDIPISENIDYFKNGVYSLINNLKTPVKIMAGVLTIGYEGFKLTSMKFATKSAFVSSGNELFKKYYIDELKATLTIASASYSLKSNLNEIKCGDSYSDENDYDYINDSYVDSTDAYYSGVEHTLL